MDEKLVNAFLLSLGNYVFLDCLLLINLRHLRRGQQILSSVCSNWLQYMSLADLPWTVHNDHNMSLRVSRKGYKICKISIICTEMSCDSNDLALNFLILILHDKLILKNFVVVPIIARNRITDTLFIFSIDLLPRNSPEC